MEIDIRLIEEKDKEIFEKLYRESVMEDFPEYTEKTRHYLTTGVYKENMWKLPLRLGAYIGDAMVGYVLCENPFGGVAFAHWLAVDKKYRGKGVGKKLLEKLTDLLKDKGAHAIHLQADKKNIGFYEKCGYDVYGEDNKGYFGAHDFLLRKIIQSPKEDTFVA